MSKRWRTITGYTAATLTGIISAILGPPLWACMVIVGVVGVSVVLWIEIDE